MRLLKTLRLQGKAVLWGMEMCEGVQPDANIYSVTTRVLAKHEKPPGMPHDAPFRVPNQRTILHR